VPLQVVDADQRQPLPEGQPFGEVDADEQAAGQAGAARHGDGVEGVVAEGGFLHRLADDRADDLDVGAGGDLREDAAVRRMQVNLGGDDIGDDVPPVADDGGSGLVATGFDAQDQRHGQSSVMTGRAAGAPGVPVNDTAFPGRMARGWCTDFHGGKQRRPIRANLCLICVVRASLFFVRHPAA